MSLYLDRPWLARGLKIDVDKSITINTVQGIGDLFWVYQKLAPHFDAINVNVLCVDMKPVQLRAKVFLGMLPKIGEVTYQKVLSARYHNIARTTYRLPTANGQAVDYAVNAPLEVGVNLRDIDPGAELQEFVDMGLPANVGRGSYLCAFVAGSKGPTLWPASQWGLAIKQLMAALGTKKVALIGAEWDLPVQAEVCAWLRKNNVDAINYVGLGLAESIGIIRGAKFFLGFQSGLNVIAENYDVPQLMIYFSKLRPMMFTWCKPASIGKTFHAATFADDFDQVVARLNA